jgi:hypothetical protein
MGFLCMERDLGGVQCGADVGDWLSPEAVGPDDGQLAASGPKDPDALLVWHQLALEEIGADELGRVASGRPVADIVRGAGLRHTTVLEEHQAVGERHRFDRIVRDEDARTGEVGERTTEQRAELGLGLGVDRRERFV